MQARIEFTVSKAMTRKDLMKMNFRYFFRTRLVKRFFLICLVPCLLGIALNFITSIFSAGPLIPSMYIVWLLLIPVFLFTVMMLNVVFFTVRQMKVNKKNLTNVTYRLDERGFTRIRGDEEFHEPWSRFYAWSENNRFFFVHMNDEQKSLHFIPKWGLKSGEEQDKVRRLLQQAVKEE
jgi:hypothetical protein